LQKKIYIYARRPRRVVDDFLVLLGRLRDLLEARLFNFRDAERLRADLRDVPRLRLDETDDALPRSMGIVISSSELEITLRALDDFRRVGIAGVYIISSSAF
jgi:hypothetical protein